MDLYLVVKHEDDTTSNFDAEWVNETNVKWTECNDKVLADCKQLLNTNKDGWVYIYRPAYSGDKTSTICCKAHIAKIEDGAKKVFFKDQTPVMTPTTLTFDKNMFSKWAAAPTGQTVGKPANNPKARKTA